MNAVQCDYCGKFAENPEGGKHMMEKRLPKGWWLAVAEQLDQPRVSRFAPGVGGEFCSLDCASKFFAKPRGDE